MYEFTKNISYVTINIRILQIDFMKGRVIPMCCFNELRVFKICYFTSIMNWRIIRNEKICKKDIRYSL